MRARYVHSQQVGNYRDGVRVVCLLGKTNICQKYICSCFHSHLTGPSCLHRRSICKVQLKSPPLWELPLLAVSHSAFYMNVYAVYRLYFFNLIISQLIIESEGNSHSVLSNLCDPIVPGILQARVLDLLLPWVAIPFPRGSSQPKD